LPLQISVLQSFNPSTFRTCRIPSKVAGAVCLPQIVPGGMVFLPIHHPNTLCTLMVSFLLECVPSHTSFIHIHNCSLRWVLWLTCLAQVCTLLFPVCNTPAFYKQINFCPSLETVTCLLTFAVSGYPACGLLHVLSRQTPLCLLWATLSFCLTCPLLPS
jgi:hypothetical protein